MLLLLAALYYDDSKAYLFFDLYFDYVAKPFKHLLLT